MKWHGLYWGFWDLSPIEASHEEENQVSLNMFSIFYRNKF